MLDAGPTRCSGDAAVLACSADSRGLSLRADCYECQHLVASVNDEVHGAFVRFVRTGPPGVGLEVSGAGYSDCRFVYVFIDGQRIGTLRPDAGGAIGGGGFSVPGDVSPGPHAVTTSCQSSGGSVRAIAASSSRTRALVWAGSVNRSPFRPHRTELKDVERAGA